MKGAKNYEEEEELWGVNQVEFVKLDKLHEKANEKKSSFKIKIQTPLRKEEARKKSRNETHL
jgi:hypothetical protein